MLDTPKQTSPTFLHALRQSIQLDHEDTEARARLVPRLSDGRITRPRQPTPDITPRTGAVLILLYPYQERLYTPLTVRSSHLRHHRGEISLPGGKVDPTDDSLIATALREAAEEIALDTSSTEVWGTLTTVYIPPSNFLITPVVAWCDHVPELHPSQSEVAEIIPLPTFQLLDPDALKTEQRNVRGEALTIPFYSWQQYKIWGATSIILSQLAARIDRALLDLAKLNVS